MSLASILLRRANVRAVPIRALTTSLPSRAALATELTSKPTVLLASPAPEYIKQEEIDVELLTPQQAQIVITDRAAEQLRSISTREANPNAALRIAVESGGCHGYQYKMELAEKRGGDDYHFSHPTVKPSNILVDAVSLTLLNGSTIDFATELIGSSFRVTDNPHAKGSGCGCGVSWELKS
ncbi:Fe-S-biosyn domain-containing protein [Mycena indigotica]|uniref:Fe-S-biosyn domain-containing protein n=1 Tax=Mycena indigotica TaxID=2126181 RepID=A0A8H6WFY1_9AGAR|nr:Fe-S-biosyn domain-containing protein [Mycena indigotica]KAF7315241.1 Fe-S-biosyn domain-containing protein [Mycena indigotica]